MVQLKRDLPYPTKGAPDNTYWAVGDRGWNLQVQEQKFRTKKYADVFSEPATARTVTDRANRKERGLLNYEDCTTDELETFIIARHLNLPNKDTYNIQVQATTTRFRDTQDRQLRQQKRHDRLPKAKKAAYIAVLHEADDGIVFDKFFDLHAEIRKIVYEKYCEDFTHLSLPYQPPLALASKDLRAEALPFFYQASTFVLRVKVSTRIDHNGRLMGNPGVFLYNTAADPDLLTSANLPQVALSRISRLRLCLLNHLSSFDFDDIVLQSSVSWDIDLTGTGGPVLGKEGAPNHFGQGPYLDSCRERLESGITRVLRDVWARPKAHKLRRGDLKDLRRAVHEALILPVDG